MIATIKNLTHHAAIPEGALRIVPTKGGKTYLIVAANGQAIAETIPTQNPLKSMCRGALLAHALNVIPTVTEVVKRVKDAVDDKEIRRMCEHGQGIAEDLSKIGV